MGTNNNNSWSVFCFSLVMLFSAPLSSAEETTPSATTGTAESESITTTPATEPPASIDSAAKTEAPQADQPADAVSDKSSETTQTEQSADNANATNTETPQTEQPANDVSETSTNTTQTEQPAETASAVNTATTTSPEPAKQLQKLSVTGSHIKRLNLEGPSPVVVIDREYIEQSGASSLSELLRKLPINNGDSSNEYLTQATSPGASGINLRGLGQDATLVLLNGRRVASYAFAQETTDTFVDLNSIPLGAIDHIEVQKDGASAIYGSDALAGVVNIILRSDFDRSEVSLEVGQSAKGDANETHLSLATGITKDTDNLTFVLNYFKREGFLLGDRGFSKSATQKNPYDPTSPGVDHLAFAPDNNPANYVDTAFPPTVAVFNGAFDPNPYITAVPSTERLGGLLTWKKTINARLDFISEFMANQVVTDYQSPPTALWGDYDGVTFPASHPTNPTATPGPPTDLYLYWRITEAGPRKDHVETNALRYVGGLQGSTNSFDWEFNLNLNRSSSTVTGTNYINRLALIDAFNNGLLDPFGTSNPSDIESIKTTTSRQGISKLYAAEGKITTEVGDMDGGPIGIAAGAERHYESLDDTPDKLTEEGQVIGQGSTRSSGDRYVSAAYGEASLPVTDQVEMQLAYRIENYSDFGTTSNPKLAVRYQPNSTVLLRASWGTGFRAPSLPELYQGQTSGYDQLVDTRRCAAAGLDCAPAYLPVSFGGNRNLDPEKSNSIYLGTVIAPVKALSVGLDYWRYNQEDVIDANTQYVLDNESNFPDRVIRDSSLSTGPGDPGPIVAINDSYVNIGEQRTDGIDVSLNYQWEVTAVGTFNIQSVITRVLSFERKAYPGASFEDKLGDYQYPKLRGNLTFGWQKQAFAASLTANYIGEHKDEFYGRDWYFDGPADKNRDFHVIDAYTSYDAQFNYTHNKSNKFTFGIKNLTNQDPPLSNASNLGYDPYMYDPTGRYYYARYNYEF